MAAAAGAELRECVRVGASLHHVLQVVPQRLQGQQKIFKIFFTNKYFSGDLHVEVEQEDGVVQHQDREHQRQADTETDLTDTPYAVPRHH